MNTTTFNVPSISCSNCSNKIQQELRSMKGVEIIDVDLKTQMVKVDYDPGAIQPSDISKRILSMGYEVIRQ